MRASTITKYFKPLKQEPVFETDTLDLNISFECTSAVIKSESKCYIKEEIDIPDYISNADSLCIKPCIDSTNRTCLVVIKRLSDSVLQKYLGNKKQSKEIIVASDKVARLNKENVEDSATKNQQTGIPESNGTKNLRKRKRSDSGITELLNTSQNKDSLENCDTSCDPKEIIVNDGGETIRKRGKSDIEATETCTNLNKENKQTTYKDNKQKDIIKRNGEKKVRGHEKPGITKFFKSLNNEAISLLEDSTSENCDTNNRQDKIVKSNDIEDAKKYSKNTAKDGPASTDFYTSFCPKCKKTCKTRKAIEKCFICKTRLRFECKKCHKQLGSHNGMANHVRAVCSDHGYFYECFKCGFRSILRYAVINHLKRVHPDSNFPERIKQISSKEVHADVTPIDKCSKCRQQFDALYKLVQHIQICNSSKDTEEHLSDYAVSKDKILRYCSTCDETIKDVGTDKKICIKCKMVMAYKCSICEKLYTACGGVINHIVKIHNEREWECPKCDFKSGSMICLTSHYKRMHNPQVFECTKCRTTWKSREHLKRHLRKCGVKPHLYCDHCPYKTGVREFLKTHILNVHFQENKSVACPKCQKICKNETLLKIHLRTICDKEANFQCEHCPFKTKFKSSIMKHIQRHHLTGSKYECCKCKHQFENNKRLKKHLLRCGIERPFQCKRCSFKTFKEQYLRCHMKNKHQNGNGIIP